MSAVGRASVASLGGVEQVAPYLPATAPAPEPARRIGFLRALLLYWIIPGRLGPHLAVDTWKRAVAAYVISLLFAGSVVWHIATGSEEGLLRELTSPHEVRKMLAGALLELTTRVPSIEMGMVKVLMVLSAVFLIGAVPVMLAGFSMPWCAGGDDGKSVGRRCIKNAYWATTVLIPATLLYWVACALIPHGSGMSLRDLGEQAPLPVLVGVIVVAVLLVPRMLLAGAGRYVGEAVGPGFSPREPLCGQCGYCITGLPMAGRCPECGTPVRDSLPGGKRRPTAWQRYEFSRRGFVELIRLQKQVLLDPGFLQTLPVHEGLSSARRFWWGTFLLMIPATLVMFGVVEAMMRVIEEGRVDAGDEGIRRLPLVLLAPLVIQVMVMFVASQYAEARLKIKDYRVSAAVCFHSSPLIWPLALMAPLWALAISGRLNRMIEDEWIVPMFAVRLTVTDVLRIIVGLMACGALWFLSARLGRALRAARYANG